MGMLSFFLNQTCAIYPFIREGSGEPIYGDPEYRKCRLETGGNLKTTGVGTGGNVLQVTASARMFCEGEYIPSKSRVVLDGRNYIVINCDICRTMVNHHLEVYLE